MADRYRAILCRYSEEGHLVPLQRYERLASDQFKVGEEYPIVVEEQRSIVSHRHFFASVNSVWENLPEHLQKQYPSPEHLRAWALVESGYYHDKSVVCASRNQAMQMAALVRSLSPLSIITISKTGVLRIFEAMSQAVHGPNRMDKATFQASKTAVLDLISGMIGLTAADLKKETSKTTPLDRDEEKTDGEQ